MAGSPTTVGRIIREDERLNRYLASDAVIEVLASGFTWTEGPVWVGDSLLFSDIPRNTIFRWQPGGTDNPAGSVSIFMKPSGYTGVAFYGKEPGSNGLTLDASGRLTLCEHGDRRISRLTSQGGKLTLVDRFEGRRLNSPNDLVFDTEGNLYFTDPPYGLPNRFDDHRRELDFCGVYRLAANGQLTLLTKSIQRPNGIGLSPDQKTLYVAQSNPDQPNWTAFPLSAAGTLGPGRQIAEASDLMSEAPGLPDGMAIHSSGALFASGPGGVYVMLPSGERLGRIHTGGRVSNCTFDSDESTLYITADDQLCRVAVKTN
ncbi:MAG: SMP-30/gluconolactonase/LRE family protein [Planctomycetota bacterium]